MRRAHLEFAFGVLQQRLKSGRVHWLDKELEILVGSSHPSRIVVRMWKDEDLDTLLGKLNQGQMCKEVLNVRVKS